MVTDAAHEEGVWWIPPHGGRQADGAETAEGMGWRLGLPPSRGCNGVDRLSGGGELHIPPPEHSRTLY